ncbi:MAG: hypothetical protein GVY13_06885, partial [Alphaproteobacteria bacterium]|nr:hypothetical protein [Alphaproteobacteria bacterium]
MAANSDDPAPPSDLSADPSNADLRAALQQVQARLDRCEREIARMAGPEASAPAPRPEAA